MPDLVHLMPMRYGRRAPRTGLSARSRGHTGDRGVYCLPVLASYALTHQWVRELRRWHPGPLVAVWSLIPDHEPVAAGHYGAEPSVVEASEAVAVVRGQADPRGYEVFVPRSIAAAEVRRVRANSTRRRLAVLPARARPASLSVFFVCPGDVRCGRCPPPVLDRPVIAGAARRR